MTMTLRRSRHFIDLGRRCSALEITESIMNKYLAGALMAVFAGWNSSLLGSPLIHFSLLGRVQNSEAQFSRSIGVLPGQTVEYQIIGEMAAIGTSNTQINSLGNP